MSSRSGKSDEGLVCFDSLEHRLKEIDGNEAIRIQRERDELCLIASSRHSTHRFPARVIMTQKGEQLWQSDSAHSALMFPVVTP